MKKKAGLRYASTFTNGSSERVTALAYGTGLECNGNLGFAVCGKGGVHAARVGILILAPPH
jgi:hypothetical protein